MRIDEWPQRPFAAGQEGQSAMRRMDSSMRQVFKKVSKGKKLSMTKKWGQDQGSKAEDGEDEGKLIYL